MKEYINVLKHTLLFRGISENDIEALLGCLEAKKRIFFKGEYVYRQGEFIDNITLVLRGKLYIQREDYWGNSNIITQISDGELFGEAYVAPGSGNILNNVIAVEESEIMFFDARKIISVCPSACKFHSKVIENLFFAISEKNRKLVQKLSFMSNRTTREKLIAYLSEEANRQNSSVFTIPFNRQQLADYLSVDRSAMSNELCKMRDDGLIKFDRSKFTLI